MHMHAMPCDGTFQKALIRKAKFPYECLLKRAITCRDMHVHAVLCLKEASILSLPEERMARWPRRPDM